MARWLRRDLVNDNKCITSVYIKIPRNRRHGDFNPRNRHSEFLLANFFSVFGTSAGFLGGAARILSILKYKISCNIQRKGYFPHFSYIFITFCVPTLTLLTYSTAHLKHSLYILLLSRLSHKIEKAQSTVMLTQEPS